MSSFTLLLDDLFNVSFVQLNYLYYTSHSFNFLAFDLRFDHSSVDG